MNPQRATFLSGAILGLFLGVFLGHFTLWRRSLPVVQAPESHEVINPGSPFEYSLGPRFAAISDAERSEGADQSRALVPLPDEPVASSQSPLVNAIAMTEEENPQQPVSEAEEPPGVEEPQPLTIEEATPIQGSKSEKEAAMVRAIIDAELNDIPEPQREVWYDALKDEKKEDVAGILKMWKLFGGPIPSALRLDQLDRDLPPLESVVPEPDLIPRSSTEDFVTDAYEIATMIRRRNLEMAFTPGYLREVPYFEERVTKDGRPFYEVHSAIDFQSATLLTTGIPLDLGIQGPGFFQVTDENGQKFFTRRGRFALSEENELVLIDGDRQLRLTPKITINRDDLAGITISPTGHLSYESIEDSLDDADGTERILLVLPVSGWYLEVLANGLFQMSPGHEKELLTIGPGEGAGTIRQGALEVPRFDLDGERSALMDLEQLTRSRN